MFEEAVKLKVRFNYKGQCSVEDLWDLSVEELDMIFKELNVRLKEQKEESLLEKKTQADKILELQVNIVKYIVKVKLEEQKARENEMLKTARKQKLLGVIAEKQDAKLHDMTIEDLNKLVEDLGN